MRRATAALLILWLVAPLVPLVIWSFAHGWRFPDLLPTAWSLRAWTYALSPAAGVGSALTQSLLVALSVTGIALIIGLPAGRALGMQRFRGKAAAELIILLPLIVPGLAAALGLHGVFTMLHLTGTRTGVVLVHLIPALPYMVLVLAAAFARHDPAWEDQARSLGAAPVQVFFRVTLPMILPGVLAASALTFLVSWSQYLLTLMIGGGRVETLPLLLFSVAGAGRNDLTGAVAIIYVVPGLLFLALTAGRISGLAAARESAA